MLKAPRLGTLQTPFDFFNGFGVSISHSSCRLGHSDFDSSLQRGYTNRMVCCASIVQLFCLAIAENLLLNPSFEQAEGDIPTHWNVFVMPQPGAETGLDEQHVAHGKRSVRIHNADRYEQEPYNNWSQNVRSDVAGKTLIVGGLIKTDTATGAALWLQCWRKDPWSVVQVATTSDTFPVSGTKDWTPVAMKVVVPRETDFVVVRCVLNGVGTAWFDDLRLLKAEADGEEEKEVNDLVDALSREKGKPLKTKATRAEREDLARETEALARNIQALRETNDALNNELTQLREELRALKEQLQAAGTGASVTPESAKSGFRVPPLVPHGFNVEDLR